MSALNDTERAAVGAMWSFRASAEHETAAKYQDLAPRLAQGGVSAALVERVAAAGRDEVRHRVLCADLAGRLGCPPPPFMPVPLRRIAPHDLGGGGRLCYEMVALFCVTESINATLLLRSWEQATDEAARAVLHALLADEVEHSRIGWAYLASEPGWRSEVACRLPLILAATTHDEGFLADPSPPPESPALAAHGLLSQEALRRVFLEAMEEVVLPGLEVCGIDPAEAHVWLRGCTARWNA
jgi:hypothetical protein